MSDVTIQSTQDALREIAARQAIADKEKQGRENNGLTASQYSQLQDISANLGGKWSSADVALAKQILDEASFRTSQVGEGSSKLEQANAKLRDIRDHERGHTGFWGGIGGFFENTVLFSSGERARENAEDRLEEFDDVAGQIEASDQLIADGLKRLKIDSPFRATSGADGVSDDVFDANAAANLPPVKYKVKASDLDTGLRGIAISFLAGAGLLSGKDEKTFTEADNKKIQGAQDAIRAANTKALESGFKKDIELSIPAAIAGGKAIEEDLSKFDFKFGPKDKEQTDFHWQGSEEWDDISDNSYAAVENVMKKAGMTPGTDASAWENKVQAAKAWFEAINSKATGPDDNGAWPIDAGSKVYHPDYKVLEKLGLFAHNPKDESNLLGHIRERLPKEAVVATEWTVGNAKG